MTKGKHLHPLTSPRIRVLARTLVRDEPPPSLAGHPRCSLNNRGRRSAHWVATAATGSVLKVAESRFGLALTARVALAIIPMVRTDACAEVARRHDAFGPAPAVRTVLRGQISTFECLEAQTRNRS